MEIDNERLKGLLTACINYIAEIKNNNMFESADEIENFWIYTIGLNQEELEYFGLNKE